jgi:hypothetical protein
MDELLASIIKIDPNVQKFAKYAGNIARIKAYYGNSFKYKDLEITNNVIIRCENEIICHIYEDSHVAIKDDFMTMAEFIEIFEHLDPKFEELAMNEDYHYEVNTKSDKYEESMKNGRYGIMAKSILLSKMALNGPIQTILPIPYRASLAENLQYPMWRTFKAHSIINKLSMKFSTRSLPLCYCAFVTKLKMPNEKHDLALKYIKNHHNGSELEKQTCILQEEFIITDLSIIFIGEKIDKIDHLEKVSCLENERLGNMLVFFTLYALHTYGICGVDGLIWGKSEHSRTKIEFGDSTYFYDGLIPYFTDFSNCQFSVITDAAFISKCYADYYKFGFDMFNPAKRVNETKYTVTPPFEKLTETEFDYLLKINEFI